MYTENQEYTIKTTFAECNIVVRDFTIQQRGVIFFLFQWEVFLSLSLIIKQNCSQTPDSGGLVNESVISRGPYTPIQSITQRSSLPLSLRVEWVRETFQIVQEDIHFDEINRFDRPMVFLSCTSH